MKLPNKNNNIDSYYQTLYSCCNLDDFTQRIHTIVKNLGFTDYWFMHTNHNWDALSKNGLLHSFPDEFMRIYHEQRMHKIDLTIPYSQANTQPAFSSQIYGYINEAPFEIELTYNNRLLQQLYRRFDFHEHYIIAQPASDGDGHVQLLLTSRGSKQQDIQAAVTTSINRACMSLCKAIDSVRTKKFRTLMIKQTDNSVNITSQPLNLLHQLANTDTTITKLAKKMRLSPITAHQHIASARKALGVKTTIGAVTKAIKTGLIGID